MKLLKQIYKHQMFLSLFIAVLILWGVSVTGLAFLNKAQLVIIGKTKDSYQIIDSEEKDPVETSNFIRHFIALTLNFDKESYKRHISLAGDLMTESLWEKKKPEFQEMADFIKKHKVIQSSEVLSIKKIKSSLYEIQIRNYLFKKGNLTEKDKLILLSLTENQRSFENPWRLSVSRIEIK